MMNDQKAIMQQLQESIIRSRAYKKTYTDFNNLSLS